MVVTTAQLLTIILSEGNMNIVSYSIDKLKGLYGISGAGVGQHFYGQICHGWSSNSFPNKRAHVIRETNVISCDFGLYMKQSHEFEAPHDLGQNIY